MPQSSVVRVAFWMHERPGKRGKFVMAYDSERHCLSQIHFLLSKVGVSVGSRAKLPHQTFWEITVDGLHVQNVSNATGGVPAYCLWVENMEKAEKLKRYLGLPGIGVEPDNVMRLWKVTVQSTFADSFLDNDAWNDVQPAQRSNPVTQLTIPYPTKPAAPINLQPKIPPAVLINHQPKISPAAPINYQPKISPAAPINYQPKISPAAPMSYRPNIPPVAPVNHQPKIPPAPPMNYQSKMPRAAPGNYYPKMPMTPPMNHQPKVPSAPPKNHHPDMSPPPSTSVGNATATTPPKSNKGKKRKRRRKRRKPSVGQRMVQALLCL